MRGMLLLLVASASIVFGQGVSENNSIDPDLKDFRYPPLARSARVQGAVRFVIKGGQIELLAGNPMLARAARSNLEKWNPTDWADKEFVVDYIFQMTPETGTQIVEREEQIGNGFSRFFLRIFHRPTNRKVREEICRAGKELPATYRRDFDNGRPLIEIKIQIGAACLQTNRTVIATLKP